MENVNFEIKRTMKTDKKKKEVIPPKLQKFISKKNIFEFIPKKPKK